MIIFDASGKFRTPAEVLQPGEYERSENGTLYIAHVGALFVRRIAAKGKIPALINIGAPLIANLAFDPAGDAFFVIAAAGPTFRDSSRIPGIALPGLDGRPLIEEATR
ncbi:hypothetical protein AAD018_012075 [Aestuariibius insulae]|uniref:hypothetical protein n=1 Tax=Aestuariibius insulae TaxID=2058287 RepID=UPI00345E6FED